MVHDGEERERFSTLTLAYMSDESSVDEASGTIPIHKPEWRSESNTSCAIVDFLNFISTACCCIIVQQILTYQDKQLL